MRLNKKLYGLEELLRFKSRGIYISSNLKKTLKQFNDWEARYLGSWSKSGHELTQNKVTQFLEYLNKEGEVTFVEKTLEAAFALDFWEMATNDSKKSYRDLYEKLDLMETYKNRAALGLGLDDKKKRLNLRDIVNNITPQYRHRFNEKGIYLDIDIHRGVTVECWESPFISILLNLFDNAAKYALNHTIVTLEADANSMSIRNICLYDENLGDPFLPGIRGNAGHNVEGEGLGLTTVNIVSKAMGFGCEFNYPQLQSNSEKAIFEIVIYWRKS